jgi:membrane fusion protein, peptide pheromone/bacteriocin exporter
MAKKIFPSEILEFTVEDHFVKHSTNTKIIYAIVILSLLAAFIALPFIKVDISVQSTGIIKPKSAKTQVNFPVSGKVKAVLVQENEQVSKGETLVVIDPEVLNEKIKYLSQKTAELKIYIHDLQTLILNSRNSSSPEYLKLNTLLYVQEWQHFQEKLREVQASYRQHEKAYERNLKLLEAKAIAVADFEPFQYNFEEAKNQSKLTVEAQLSQWESRKLQYEKELREVQASISQLEKEKERFVIKAPVSGTLQNAGGIYPGGVVFTNQMLGEISPDSGLVVEAYIPPKDIGFIKEGMKVRFQIDAFNYNQWGMAEGVVEEVSNDVLVIDSTPVFKVRCSLGQDHLELKNGYRGKLKKGMTLNARYIVTQRSLYQLLYDKASDWFDPHMNN